MKTKAFREAGVILPNDLFDRLVALCRATSVDELAESRTAVIQRGEQLAESGVATRHVAFAAGGPGEDRQRCVDAP